MSSPTSTIDTQPMPPVQGAESSNDDISFSRALLDQIREGVVRFEKDLSIRSGNRSWLTMVGLEADGIREKNLAEILDPEDLESLRAALTTFTAASEGGEAASPARPPVKNPELSLTWKSADGRRIDSHTVIFAGFEPSDTHPEGTWVFSGLVHDLTVENLAAEERKRLQDRLRGGHKNESMGILAGGLAHDFNNVLTAIIGLADVAGLQLDDTSSLTPVIHEIRKTADHAAILVRNLLTYARRGKQTTEVVDLAGLVRELAQWVTVTLQPEAEIEVSCAAGLPSTLGDPVLLRQAITNLILNAGEALPPAGSRQTEGGRRARSPRIRIEAGISRVDPFELQKAVFAVKPLSGPHLFVEVWDNGCGIEPEVAPRIFDPFFTTKPASRGLGLAAVQGIAYSHGGFLRVDSEPGRGTSMRLYLPISQTPTAGEPIGPNAEPEVHPLKGRILVVDDEEAVRGIAKATLEMAGYEVALASDGQDGWEQVQSQPDAFAGILLDITMPKMTGDEMLAKVREIRPRLPVLLSSGFSSNEACFSTTDDPYTRFLKKPYRTRQLKQEIADLVALAETETPQPLP